MQNETAIDMVNSIKGDIAALIEENAELRECLRYCVSFIGDSAEPLGADCDTIEMIKRANELLKGDCK